MIEELIRALKSSAKGDKAEFQNKEYSAIEISKDNFHELKDGSAKKIVFIDGGNCELVSAPNVALQMVRVAAVFFEDNKRKESKKIEFHVLTEAFGDGKEIRYRSKIFSKDIAPDEKDLEFNSFDKTISEGNHRGSVTRIGEVARRFAELEMVNKVIDELEKGDIIVIDGTLEPNYTNETNYFEKIYKKVDEKGVLICGLAKTCSLLTDEGGTLTTMLGKIGTAGKWYYYPIADIKKEDHKAEMYFVKLHEKSDHVFRFEIYNKQKENAVEVIEAVAMNSKDLTFPGYPYGLIFADRIARISRKEEAFEKAKITARAGKEIEGLASAMNAHDILDNI
ncbi:MAG: DNA double-strand break repair nuclease NurA [bacterium]|nr:DNA double-strand break repair nuclease NurA [bacterium]